MIALLDEEISVLALDLPGFGDSPDPVSVIDSLGYAEAVARVVRDWRQQADLAQIVIVGHSFGGRVAIELASQVAPELVDALVLTGVPIIRPMGHSKPALSFRAVRWLATHGLASSERLERARSRYGSEDYRQATGIMRSIFVRVVNEDHLESLCRIELPIVMIWGSADSACSVDLAQQAAEKSPTASLIILDGIHHFVPFEDPQSIADHIGAIVSGS